MYMQRHHQEKRQYHITVVGFVVQSLKNECETRDQDFCVHHDQHRRLWYRTQLFRADILLEKARVVFEVIKVILNFQHVSFCFRIAQFRVRRYRGTEGFIHSSDLPGSRRTLRRLEGGERYEGKHV
ncbi:hypothetical protein AAMO2058_000072700 [Amorphochlora amoebiformis]